MKNLSTLSDFKIAVSIYYDLWLESNVLDPDLQLSFSCVELATSQGYEVKLEYNISLGYYPSEPYGRVIEPEYSDRTVFLRYDQSYMDLRDKLFDELEEISKIKIAA